MHATLPPETLRMKSPELSWLWVIAGATVWIVLALSMWQIYARTQAGLPRGFFTYGPVTWRDTVRAFVWPSLVLAPPAAMIVFKSLLR